MRSFGAFLRSAPLSVLGSTAARAHELTTIDGLLRAPLPLSRRVGFVSLRGGAGCSATAAAVASVLARRRTGAVLGIDASASTNGLHWYAGLAATAEQKPSARRRSARRFDDAVDGLPRTASGLWALRLPDTGGPSAPAASRSWWDQASPITRFFDVVVTDWGVRDRRLDLADAVAASHVVCLIARADRHAAEEAASLVGAIRGAENAPEVVLALVDTGGTGGRAPDLVAEALDVPVVWIPYDAARASSRPVGSPAQSTRLRVGSARLAAAVVEAGLASTVRRPAPAPEPEATR